MVEQEINKILVLDLFAGCGGLSDGFLQTSAFEEVAAVEWKKPQVDTLRHRLKTKWRKSDVDESILLFDIQKEDELFHGNDEIVGLDNLVNKKGRIDVIIGGPPCQAYSIAGRVRDENGMKSDYRNYLFEHYLSIVNRYKPDVFIFENVPGLLSANPTGTPVVQLISQGFAKIGYTIYKDLSKTQVNAADFGVPQSRRRLIILGVCNDVFANIDLQSALTMFYEKFLPSFKVKKHVTVREAIGDLPVCSPYLDNEHHKKRISHKNPICKISWHRPRYHNLRDMDTFRTLAADIESGQRVYDSKKITELYEEKVGSKSPIHRYHVLEPDQVSTTIIAHLYKDGNRFIHYDSKQCRTITPREAARLQSFDDDFDFIGSQGAAYEMIGNAVPPKLANCVAKAVIQFLKTFYPSKYDKV